MNIDDKCPKCGSGKVFMAGGTTGDYVCNDYGYRGWNNINKCQECEKIKGEQKKPARIINSDIPISRI